MIIYAEIVNCVILIISNLFILIVNINMSILFFFFRRKMWRFSYLDILRYSIAKEENEEKE